MLGCCTLAAGLVCVSTGCSLWKLLPGNSEGSDTGSSVSAPIDCELTLSHESVTLELFGENTAQLTATTAEGDFVLYWSSSDTSVAKVEKGLVTAVGPGTATVTVTCKQKNKSKTLATKTCEVTVTAPEDYYAIEYGQETTKNAMVVANPGHWYLFSITNSYTYRSTYSLGGNAYVAFEELATGKEWYLRYQPALEGGEVCKVTMKLTLSDPTYVRFAGGQSGMTVKYYEAGENQVELNYIVSDTSAFSITLCSDPSGEKNTFAGGTFSFAVEDIAFTPILSLSQSTATIDLMQTSQLQLTAKDPSGGPIEWTSSDESVATVDENGLVTALSVGEAIITATANGDAASCTVTVLQKTISLSAKAVCIGLGEGNATTLTAEVSDGSPVEWTSSDESIVRVDENGLILGMGKGNAEITATSGSISATCKVYVYDPAGEYEVVYGKASVASNAIVAANPETWYIFDEYTGCDGASYENGTLTASFAKAGKTLMFRYQPMFETGTKYTVTFTIEVETEGEVVFNTFKYTGTNGNVDAVQQLQEGTRTFTTTATVGSTPLTIQFKMDQVGTVKISNLVFTIVE